MASIVGLEFWKSPCPATARASRLHVNAPKTPVPLSVVWRNLRLRRPVHVAGNRVYVPPDRPPS